MFFMEVIAYISMFMFITTILGGAILFFYYQFKRTGRQPQNLHPYFRMSRCEQSLRYIQLIMLAMIGIIMVITFVLLLTIGINTDTSSFAQLPLPISIDLIVLMITSLIFGVITVMVNIMRGVSQTKCICNTAA